jgi:cytochrome oxidase Cu insertion factor (SCO1/SenC/PrrC family)
MTSGSTGSSHESDALSDDQRSEIFAAANAPRVRLGRVRAPRAPIPKKFVLWAVAAIVFLGVGGQIAGHYFQSYGKAPKTTTTTTTPVLNLAPTTLPTSTTLTSLEAYIGLKFIGSAKAHPFTLTTQSNKSWSLSRQKGKVVVLAFYNSICNDICPVLGAEIRRATQELGSNKKKIVFAIVNTDPKQRSISPASQALSIPGLTASPSVVFLSGNVTTLDTVWRAYGIRIIVGAKVNQVSHNNALYFVSPRGDLVAYADPFATQSKSGVYSLSAPVMQRYAQGIAATASSLVK